MPKHHINLVSRGFLNVAVLFEKRWVIQITKVLVDNGDVYFSDFTRAIPELSDRLLSLRLRELGAAGLVEKIDHDGHRPSYKLAQSDQAVQIKKIIQEIEALAQIVAVKD
jgi:DNA-binding HxlR family transcriptional regulator